MIKFEKMDPDLQKNKLTKLQILTQTYAHRTLQRQNEKEKRKKKRKGHQIQIQTDFKKEKMQKKTGGRERYQRKHNLEKSTKTSLKKIYSKINA